MTAVMAVCLAPHVWADPGQPVMKVEEDWEVVIGEPNSDEIAPQLYVVTTPTGNLDGQYSVFEINNVTLPDFYGGGLQFQTWWDDQATGEAHHNNFSALSSAGETIKFTVSMRISSGGISYRVKNGVSQTWGTFGASPSLRIWQPSELSNLAGYDPDKSARLSRVGFGRGRVTSFTLKTIRYYDGSNNLQNTDTTARDALVEEPE